MLVGDPERFDRREPDVLVLAVDAPDLPQALGPQLAEPVGHVAQALAVGHHHRDGLPPLIQQVEQRGVHRRGVDPEVAVVAVAVGLRRSRQELANVNPTHRGG